MNDASGKRPRVLLADDDALIRVVIGRQMERFGWMVSSHTNGGDALTEVLTGAPIQLAILDLDMPRMDGIEVCRLIKKLDPTVKVIICTGSDLKEVRARIAASCSDADAVVGKDAELNELTSTAHALLSPEE